MSGSPAGSPLISKRCAVVCLVPPRCLADVPVRLAAEEVEDVSHGLRQAGTGRVAEVRSDRVNAPICVFPLNADFSDDVI